MTKNPQFVSTSLFLVLQRNNKISALLLIFNVSTTLLISSSVREVLLLHMFIACIAINSSLPSLLTFCPCCFIRLFRRINRTIQKYHATVLWFKHLRGTTFCAWRPGFAIGFGYTKFHDSLLSSYFFQKKKKRKLSKSCMVNCLGHHFLLVSEGV